MFRSMFYPGQEEVTHPLLDLDCLQAHSKHIWKELGGPQETEDTFARRKEWYRKKQRSTSYSCLDPLPAASPRTHPVLVSLLVQSKEKVIPCLRMWEAG